MERLCGGAMSSAGGEGAVVGTATREMAGAVVIEVGAMVGDGGSNGDGAATVRLGCGGVGDLMGMESAVVRQRPGGMMAVAMLMEDGGAAVVMEDTVVTVGSDGMRDDGVPGLKLCGRQLWRCGGAMKQVRVVRW
ncbi:hypothetical protein F0562_021844 [Nyssa sinensis]|uniref:Uncharacterized protein n=1 Tax=Nyssa sinensis TaxID=561372 RepID=A0A5J5BM89_9ASTE|nr:hypothetical protein F0562_021844 [Nyssa sinensis]